MKSIFPYLAGAGASGVASQFSALQPFQAAIGAGAGALANSKNRVGGALQGFAGGGVGSTLAGGVKNLFTPSAAGSGFDKFGSGAMSGLQGFGSSIPGFGGIGTNNPTGALAKFFSPGSSGTGQPLTTKGMSIGPDDGTRYSNTSGKLQMPFSLSDQNTSSGFKMIATPSGGSSSLAAPVVGNSAGAATGNVASKMNPMEMFKGMIPGAAVGLLGSALAPQVQAPDYSGVKNDIMNRIQTGGNPEARNAAMQQYLSTVQAPEGASAEAGVANARLINDRQKADARKAIDAQFRANNGNTMGNSAYNDAITKSDAAYDQNYAAQAAQTQFEYDNAQKQQKMAAAQALQGMDDNQLKYYAGLADLDIMQIQEKTGMDVASSQSIKQIAQTAAELMMEKSLGLNGGARW